LTDYTLMRFNMIYW